MTSHALGGGVGTIEPTAFRVVPDMLKVLQELQAELRRRRPATQPSFSSDDVYVGGLATADSHLVIPPAWLGHLLVPICVRNQIEHELVCLSRPKTRKPSRLLQRLEAAFEGHWDVDEQKAYRDLFCLGAPTEVLALMSAVKWISYDFCAPRLRAALTPIVLGPCSQSYLDAISIAIESMSRRSQS